MIILSHLYNLNAFLAIAKPKSLNLVECCRMVRHVPDGLWNVAMKGMRTYDGPMTAHGVRDPGNGIIKFAWENPVKFIGKSTKSPWASFHSKRWVLPEGSHSKRNLLKLHQMTMVFISGIVFRIMENFDPSHTHSFREQSITWQTQMKYCVLTSANVEFGVLIWWFVSSWICEGWMMVIGSNKTVDGHTHDSGIQCSNNN